MRTLAYLSRLIIADITDPKSILVKDDFTMMDAPDRVWCISTDIGRVLYFAH